MFRAIRLSPRLPRVFPMLILAAVLAPSAFASDPLPAPEGRVLLTVSGKIAATNQGDAAQGKTAAFDRAMLQALAWREIDTYTPFDKGRQSFAGVPLAALLDRLGAGGTEIEARALNDYIMTIPVEHAERHDVLLAMDIDGKPMSVRERGPIWIIYPSDVPVTENEHRYVSQMVWQLHKITVR